MKMVDLNVLTFVISRGFFIFVLLLTKSTQSLEITGEIDDIYYLLNSSEGISQSIPLSMFQRESEDEENSAIMITKDEYSRSNWASMSYDMEIVYSFEAVDSWAVCEENGYVYVNDDTHGLMIFNSTDPSDLEFVSQYAFSNVGVRDIQVENDVVVATGTTKIYIFDVSDKSNPLLLNTIFTFLSRKIRLYVDDEGSHRLMVVDDTNAISYYDITNPHLPDLLCSERLLDQLESGDILDTGDQVLAYFATSQGLEVYDFSEYLPECRPVLKSKQTTDPYYPRNLVLVEDKRLLYIETSSSQVLVYNISDANFPELVQVWDEFIINLRYFEGYLFSNDIDYNLEIFSIDSDPYNPTRVGFLSLQSVLSEEVKDIYVDGNYTYLACVKQGVVVVDISDISNPTLIFLDVASQWNAYQVIMDSSESYLFIADQNAGFRILDIHDTSHPKMIGGYNTGDPGHQLFTLAYDPDRHVVFLPFCLGGAMRIVNVSNPHSPVLVGDTSSSFDFSNMCPKDIFYRENYVYVSGYALTIFEVSDPSNPVFVANHDWSSGAYYVSYLRSIYVTESRISFIAQYFSDVGMGVIDLSDFQNPEVIYMTETNWIGYEVLYDEDTELMFLIQSSGFSIYNCSNYSNPVLLSHTSTKDSFRAQLVDDFLFVADGYQGVSIYDVYTNVSDPIFYGSFDIQTVTQDCTSVTVRGNRIYGTYISNGIQIFDFGDALLSGRPTEDFCCGSVPITIRGRAGQSDDETVKEEFSIYFDDTCSVHGECIDDENRCECEKNERGSSYEGETCEFWTCFGIGHDEVTVCSGNGLCVSLDMCRCNSTHFGDKCEFASFSCYNVSFNTPYICGGHGYCQSQDTCVCDVGYFTIHTNNVTNDELEEFEPCSNFFCGKYEGYDSQGCNNHGTCVSSQLCSCDDGYEGSLCESWNCGYLEKDEPGVCSGNGECVAPDTCECESSYYYGEECGTNLLYLYVLTPLISMVAIFLLLSVVSTICLCCLCLIFFFLMLLTCLFFLLSVFIKQRFGIQKYSRLRNFDLLLQEQIMEEDTSIAHLRFDKKLFEIPFDEIQTERILGEGGSSSIVFLATWQGRRVAFKCFKTRYLCSTQESFDVFEREVRVMGSLSHPNVVSFYGASLKPPRIGIVMEYCEKGEIVQFFKEYYKISGKSHYPLKEKIRMIEEICSCMNYLHSRNIIHRDLKSENVLVDGQEHCKLVDFGLSRIVSEVNSRVNNKTFRVGTNIYMSPEIVRGGGDYDSKCDVFSFAILVWIIFTENSFPYGKQTFQLSNIELRVSVDEDFRPSVAELEETLKKYHKDELFTERLKWIMDLVTVSWKHDPSDRKSFQEILDEFFDCQEVYQEGESITREEGEEGSIVTNEDLKKVGESSRNIGWKIERLKERIELLKEENQKKKERLEELDMQV